MARLICCKLYVSEGRNQAVLDVLSEIARSNPLCALVQRFNDPVYHRSNFTLGGRPEPVFDTAMAVIDEAMKRLDLTKHEATHPRIGVVDHVSVHPLGQTPLSTARDLALRVGNEVAERLRVPVLFYGECNGARLADVRRRTTYFKGMEVDKSVASDAGPSEVDPRVGVVCVGAVPYIQNYNIRLATGDRALAARVTRAVRERDGGLPKVEALTLAHEGGNWEVACNLADIAESPPDKVLERAKAAAAEVGVEIERAYTIGMTGEEILEATLKLLDGREVVNLGSADAYRV